MLETMMYISQVLYTSSYETRKPQPTKITGRLILTFCCRSFQEGFKIQGRLKETVL